MTTPRLQWALPVLLASLLAMPAVAAQRVALVIGNGNYDRFGDLRNPANDARAMADRLRSVGFQLVGGKAHVDVRRREMAGLLSALEDLLSAAAPGAETTALVYYSGHGVAEGGSNWLVPVDDDAIRYREDVPDFAIGARSVTRRLEGRGAGLNILFLDACRNNPLPSRRKTKGTQSKGLTRMEAPSNTVIVYAAAPGQVAYDGVGKLSPFTAALVEEMGRPGRRLVDVLGATAAAVERETAGMPEGRQEPWLEMKPPKRPFYFVPAEKPGPVASATPGDSNTTPAAPGGSGLEKSEEVAARAYEAAERIDTMAAYEAVVRRFPDSVYAVLARENIEKLKRTVQAEPSLPTEPTGAQTAAMPAAPTEQASPPPAPSAPVTVEASLGLERLERRRVQEGLAALGFAPGPADGLFGRDTREAIGKWQVSKSATGTGYLDAEAAKALLAAGEAAARARAERERKAGEAAARAEAERKARERAAMRPGKVFRDCEECPEMVVVPAGSFTMGSPASEEDRDNDEGPQHRVTIRAPFAVGKYEVTFSEWDACVAAGGCGHRADDRSWGRGRRPVINVSWEDARSYVLWLSRKTGKRYRLLSEAEWEYAARAGTTRPFHTGSTISTDRANYNGSFSYGAGDKGTWRKESVPVGSFPANGFGLHDMHGNVWEWVEDCWNDNYAGAPSNGTAWTAGGDCGKRVLRGGSWYNKPRILRSAIRSGTPPGTATTSSGFVYPGRSPLDSLPHYLGGPGAEPLAAISRSFGQSRAREEVRTVEDGASDHSGGIS